MKFFHILLLLGLLLAVVNSQFQSPISDLYDDDNDVDTSTDDEDDDNEISYDDEDEDDDTFDSDADSPLSPSDRRERPSSDPFVIGQSENSSSSVMPCLFIFSIILFVLSF